MKTTLLALSLFGSLSLSAQSFVYTFSGAALRVNAGDSGLAPGSVYLYSKIDAAATTDAVVKITNATGGLSLSTFDQDNTANGGYTQAFQPTIVAPGTGGSGTVNGYIEFTFTFIKTGTYSTTTQTGTLLPQTSIVPATVLDDDGTLTGGTLNELDALNLGSGEWFDYSDTTKQLAVANNSGYITGTNITGTNYPGISSTAIAVMFTVSNTNLSSFVFRTGAISTFAAAPAGRVSSLAFFAPAYPFSVLGLPPFSDLRGSMAGSTVDLSWQMEASASECALERSINGQAFQAIRWYSGDSAGSLQYADVGLPAGADVAYRLKANVASGYTQYSSVVNVSIPGGSE